MKRSASQRRRPVVQITLGRAARLHRLVTMLERGPASREGLLDHLAIGLRTFYRELDLLKRCGIKVRREGKTYRLVSTRAEAEGRLPFPDPQLSFAEMAELASHPGEAARRLAEIYRGVVEPPAPRPKRRRKKAEGPG
jgi:predicted DNA-binding transcriptional regulator YafY